MFTLCLKRCLHHEWKDVYNASQFKRMGNGSTICMVTNSFDKDFYLLYFYLLSDYSNKLSLTLVKEPFAWFLPSNPSHVMKAFTWFNFLYMCIELSHLLKLLLKLSSYLFILHFFCPCIYVYINNIYSAKWSVIVTRMLPVHPCSPIMRRLFYICLWEICVLVLSVTRLV